MLARTLRRTGSGLLLSLSLCSTALARPPRIDREALVRRHNPSLSSIDPASPFMVGNGNIALTADITGLATFQDRYSARVPLMVQAQWGWHSFPNPEGFRYEQSLVPLTLRGKTQQFPWLRDWAEAKRPVIAWLRANPHRFSLGRLSLRLTSASGNPAAFNELSKTRQQLDLWTGRLSSSFVYDGAEVEVETSVHPELDLLVVKLRSSLLRSGRLGVDLKFPGVAAELNPDPADFGHPGSHQTTELARGARGIALERQLDATRYYVQTGADRDVEIQAAGAHAYQIAATGSEELTLLVAFSPERESRPLPSARNARLAVARHWRKYWNDGAVVDFSGSTDPRAAELERRVVLSQYLMAVNAAGRLPPQEEGLFSNSWNGKFHVEMHLWHAAHFATWGHPELLERSMPWYLQHLPQARARARAQGVRGAWWPKMVGPEGRESPSTITPFIMWQQPHPIYLAELLYRARPTRATLDRYRELVLQTAELLASYPHYEAARDRYVLGPPIIPAQEVYAPLVTYNPSFELEYFRFGLSIAQLWRERLGLAREAEWDRVIGKLSPLPQRDGVYLATESDPALWARARSVRCAQGKTASDCNNRDHPSFLAALGLLPGAGVDREVMRKTLRAVERDWDMRQTWGWDFPMLAMTAARLREPGRAIDFLLHDSKNFRFGVAGMTPRVHFEAHAAELAQGASPDGAGYRRAAETYFPSNGGLLLAVGLMAAGWDGEKGLHPGFPKDGSWVVRSEGLRPLP
jgi:hypothetical protein